MAKTLVAVVVGGIGPKHVDVIAARVGRQFNHSVAFDPPVGICAGQ